MQIYPQIIDRYNADRKVKTTGQFSLFDSILKEDSVNEIPYPNIPEYDNQTKLKLEKEVVGVYVSGHPLSKYLKKFNDYNFTSDMLNEDDEEDSEMTQETDDSMKEFSGIVDGMEVSCGGLLVDIKKVMTRKGNKEMAIIKIEDLYGTFEAMLFPQAYAKFKNILRADKMYTIKGKISVRVDESPTIIAEDIIPWETSEEEKKIKKTKKLYLKYDLDNAKLNFDINNILRNYLGDTEVVVKNTSDGKPYKLDIIVNPNSFLMNELYAYLDEDSIKLV